MDSSGRMWNPNQFSQPEPSNPTGPMYQNMTYPHPGQSYQNFPNQYSTFPSFNYPPPCFPPPPIPPPFLYHQSLPQSQSNNQKFSAHGSVESEIVQYENEDTNWIASWLTLRNIHPVPKKSSTSNSVKLMDVRSLLLNSSSLLRELRELQHKLSTLSECADEAEWKSALAEVKTKKAALGVLLNKIRTLDLTAIKAKLAKRAKKRGRLRRKKAKVRELKQAEQARRKTLHQRADTWLAEMTLTVEREHREEELRREADAVLGEVTRKQSEAKRQVSLLDALIKLREARAQRAAVHSRSHDDGVDHSAKKFAMVIERLRKMWNTQLKEYAGEERALRVMLSESAAQKSDARCQRVKADIDKWNKAIFGESVTSAKQNIDQLIAIRSEWDKYAVHVSVNAPMASTIPVGWVLPTSPSSDLWRQYCVAYDKGH